MAMADIKKVSKDETRDQRMGRITVCHKFWQVLQPHVMFPQLCFELRFATEFGAEYAAHSECMVQLKHLMPGVKVNKSCEVPQDDGVEEEVNRPEPPVGSI